MPDSDQVVWPDDPAEGEPAEAEPEMEPTVGTHLPATFEEALKEARAASEPAPLPVSRTDSHEFPTQPAMPAIPARTQPPPTKTMPPAVRTPAALPVDEVDDEAPTSTFKTPVPRMDGAAEPAAEVEEKPADELVSEPQSAEAEASAEPEPESASELESEQEAAAAPVESVESDAEAPEPAPQPEPALEEAHEAEPVRAEEPASEPVKAPEAQPQPEPAKAVEPQPQPQEEVWVPLPANPPVPSWAPKVAGGEPPPAPMFERPATHLPSWAPSGGRPTQNVPAAQSQPRASIPIGEALPQARPAASTPAPARGSTQAPGAADSKPKTSSWEVVQQKPTETPKAVYVPTPEDKSYSEWFAWAKRSGAPASACHAAAQGAFRALAAGQDMNTAVQWATLAMASPPGLVSASRQLYCAWYSLGNIDLRLPSPQAHAFAAGAIKALDEGSDAPTAHQAGLAAAGITG